MADTDLREQVWAVVMCDETTDAVLAVVTPALAAVRDSALREAEQAVLGMRPDDLYDEAAGVIAGLRADTDQPDVKRAEAGERTYGALSSPAPGSDLMAALRASVDASRERTRLRAPDGPASSGEPT